MARTLSGPSIISRTGFPEARGRSVAAFYGGTMQWVRVAGKMTGRRLPRRDPNRPRGLWMVQLVEYLIGIALAMMVPRLRDQVVLAVVAFSLVANASTLRAGLAAFPLVRAPVHRRIGIGLAVAIALAGVVWPMNTETRPVLFVVAGLQAFVSVRFGNGFRTTRSRPEQNDRRVGSMGEG